MGGGSDQQSFKPRLDMGAACLQVISRGWGCYQSRDFSGEKGSETETARNLRQQDAHERHAKKQEGCSTENNTELCMDGVWFQNYEKRDFGQKALKTDLDSNPNANANPWPTCIEAVGRKPTKTIFSEKY